MSESDLPMAPPPRSLLRRWLPALLGWLLAVAFLAVAVVTVSGRVLVAQMEGAEPLIAERLGRQLGLEVTITQATGRFNVLHPLLDVHGVRMRPPGAEDAFTADRIQLEVDVLRSLWHRTLVPAALVLDGLGLELERDDAGQLRLLGSEVETDIALIDVLRFFHAAGYVEIADGQLRMHRPGRGIESVELSGVLEHRRGSSRGHLDILYRVAAESEPARGQLTYRITGDPFAAQLPRGGFRLDFDELAFDAVTSTWWPDWPALEGRLDALLVAGELDPELGLKLLIETRAPLLLIDDGPEVRSLEVALQARGLGAASGQLHLLQGSAVVDGVELDLDGLDVQWAGQQEGSELRVAAARFASEPLLRLLQQTRRMPAEVQHWLNGLAPQASVHDARLLLRPQLGEFALAARLENLHLAAFRGSPAIGGADLDLVLFESGGWIDLDTGPFALHFPDVFIDAWDYDHGRGRVDLAFAPGRVRVEGRNIEIVGEGAHAHGAFTLDLPEDEAERSITLMLGIEQADAGRTPEFLPARMPPGLRAWLLDAVQAGQVDAGGVVVSGLLLPELRDGPLRPELFFVLRDGSLAFDPRWPVGRDVVGRFQVERQRFLARVESGELGGLRVEDMALRIDGIDQGLVTLDVTGKGEGTAAAALAFLRHVHDDEALMSGLDDWQASGRVRLEYDFSLPLDGSPMQAATIDVDVDLDRLEIAPPGLTVDDLRGKLAYRHPGSLRSVGLEGRLFGGPVQAELNLAMVAAASSARIDLQGRADSSELAAWTTVDTLVGASGELDYRARLEVEGLDRVQLSFEADADAVSTGLPQPLHRGTGPLKVDFGSSGDGEWTLDFDWGELAGAFRLDDGDFVAGTMAVAEELPELPEQGLRVRGHAGQVDLVAWAQALAEVEETALERGRPRTRRRTAADLDVSLAFDSTVLDGIDLGPAAMRIRGSTVAADIEIDSDPVKGRLLAVIDEPLDIQLARLRWPLVEGAELDAELDAKLARRDLEPGRIPAMDVSVAQLQWRERELGSLRFKLRPDSQMLLVDAIEADLLGLLITADEQDRSRLEWRFGARPQTRYQGRIAGADSAAVMKRWGLAPTLDAESFELALDLAWPGAPMDLNASVLDGRVSIKVENGRFVQVEAGAAPLRVVGLFNFAAIARRMRLDFTDVYRRGMAFDDIDGVLDFDSGIIRSARPIKIVGPGSSFRIAGEYDASSGLLDGDIIVTLPVSRNLPWYAAYSILLANPITGAGVLVAERVFRDQIDRFSSARYRMRGTLEQPEVTFANIFADEVDLPARISADDEPDLDWLLDDPFFWPDEFIPQLPTEESDS